MLYLFTATHQEAHTLIDFYQLKKEQPPADESTFRGKTHRTAHPHFQIFHNEEAQIRLTITGTEMLAAAVAVSVICTQYSVEEKDFLLNIGICASGGDKDGLFLCNKIIEQPTGKTFYPDILYRHPFAEAQVMTLTKPIETEKMQPSLLYDREASAIYQSGSYFFAPHQMIFLKIATGGEMAAGITPKQAENLMACHKEQITDYLSRLQELGNAKNQKNTLQEKQAEQTIANLCRDLHCSYVMEISLRQQLRYCMLAGIDYESVLEAMYREKKLPCKDKREGKLRFEELRKKLL